MALTQITRNKNPLAVVATKIATGLRERGAQWKNDVNTQRILSFESLDETELEAVSTDGEQIEGDLKQFFEDAGITEANESYTDMQWRAGVFTLMAAGNPRAYMQKAIAVGDAKGGDGVTVVDSVNGVYGHRAEHAYTLSQEAFDDRELINNLPFSVVFNIQAARQNEFGEAFYPTLVVSPDQATVDVTVRRAMVFNEVRHELSGKPMDFHRRNLVEAVLDYTVLDNQSTKIVPMYVSGGPNDNTANYSTAVGTATVKQGNELVPTRPLKFGNTFNLLGLSQTNTVQATGVLDNTDTIDHRVVLDNVYITVASASVAAPNNLAVLKFPTANLIRAGFLKSQEGYDREVMLNFVTDNLPVTYLTSDISDPATPSDTLGYLNITSRQGYVLMLGLNVSGRGNLELGNFDLETSKVSIVKVLNKLTDGTVVEITDPVIIAALKAEYTFTADSFELDARRSNLNRRTRGIQVTSVDQNERFVIPLGQPISCPNPITNTRTATDMSAPITAARIINDLNAVTKLFKYADLLSSLELSRDYAVPVPNIEGIGRLMIRPFYEEYELDLLEVTASLKSQDRAADVSAAFVNKIREMSYRAYRDSALQPALDAATGGTGERPVLLIGTDPVILRHIIVSGDTRTVSIAFDHKIVCSYDLRIRDHIFMTFVREKVAGPDPLSFGFMAWMPELATQVNITRQGAVYNETMVQPRSLHVNTCPILMKIKVKNLDKAVGEQLPINFKNV